MSETTEEIPVLETIEEEELPTEEVKPSKKEKNPNRVKAALKLSAKRQYKKEESMRKKVQDEMTKPSTWVLMGVVLTSIGFLGLYFSPLFPKQEEVNHPLPPVRQEPTPKSYFG